MNLTRKKQEQDLIQSVEEATELLRRLPVAAWAWWFGGTLPFIGALLHFWNDMSRAATAWERVGSASFTLVLFYLFMKVSHAMFGDHLMRHLRGDVTPEPLTFRGKLRLVTSQALIHSLAPWLLPLSLAAMLPFGWAYAAFHNVSILSVQILRSGGRTRDILKHALLQSHYRQGQNHGVMFVLLLFSIAVWMNLFLGMLTFASLSTSVSGSENFLTRNPWFMLSTGVMAATICASYVICGPLVKAMYALRCFYGLSRKTGEDLVVKFRHATTAAMASLLLFMPLLAGGQESVASPDELQKRIEQVLQEDDFQWRMPRQEAPQQGGIISDFAKAMSEMLESAAKSIGKWIDDGIVKWLKEMMKKMGAGKDTVSHEEPQLSAWASSVEAIMWGLLVLLVIALLIVLYRQWRRLPPRPLVIDTTPMPVNLESDAVVATQLPESEWMKLAQEKMQEGDYRLAMRALFLATLSHLGERRLIAVSRWKSNGDYRRELDFRARGRSALQEAFARSVRVFDWAWYGWHDVTRETLDDFMQNHQTILTDGKAA